MFVYRLIKDLSKIFEDILEKEIYKIYLKKVLCEIIVTKYFVNIYFNSHL